MARRRFRWSKEKQELVEVFDDQPARDQQHLLWNDRSYQDLKASDGTDISSRAKHREYMRVNNLTTIDDFKQTWKQEADRRAAYFQGQGGGAVRKEDVARVIAQLERGKR